MGQVLLVDFKKKKLLEVIKNHADENTCAHCGNYALGGGCCFACYDNMPTAAELLIKQEDNLSCGELSPLPSRDPQDAYDYADRQLGVRDGRETEED